MSNKARVGLRLKEAIGGQKSLNRSTDLVTLSQKYQAFTKKLKALINALRSQHGSLVRLQKTRTELAACISSLTKDTPLFECAGLLPSAERPSSTVLSYASIHEGLAAKSKAYSDKFGQFIIEYVVEWERVITARIDKGLKTAEELRRDLDHYQKKVESLRMNANQVMAKGKQVDGKTADKLSRNEEKFVKSKQEYNKFATDLCILIDEVTERHWRDLHPMMVKLAQFDVTLADDEAKVLVSLNQVINELKRIADANGLKPQARLKDLESLNPEILSTRPGGVAGLTIEAGTSPTNSSNNNNGSAFGTTNFSAYTSDSMAMPPGSVAPQGRGGFPVQVASSDSYDNYSRSSSFSSLPSQQSSNFAAAGVGGGGGGGPPSTMEMLKYSSSAAPPPTLEQVQAANSTSMTIRSAPNSGNYALPPLGPPPPGSSSSSSTTMASNNNAYRRSMSASYDDNMSVMSAPPVPAPAAPPPPPPMPSPLSMYQPTMSTSSLPDSMYGSNYGGGGGGGNSSQFGSPMGYSSQEAPAHPWSGGGATTPRSSFNTNSSASSPPPLYGSAAPPPQPPSSYRSANSDHPTNPFSY